MTRSPYLRDRLADLPVFRNRERPLPMAPKARCSKATADLLPQHDRAKELADRGLPLIFAALVPVGSLEVFYDESIPLGVLEVDGTRITLDEIRACMEAT